MGSWLVLLPLNAAIAGISGFVRLAAATDSAPFFGRSQLAQSINVSMFVCATINAFLISVCSFHIALFVA